MWRFRISRLVFLLVQNILCRLVVTGRENIPADGPYVLAVNHLSTADIGIVFVGFPPQEWRYFAGEKWANHPLWGPLMSWLGVIFVTRGEGEDVPVFQRGQRLAQGTPVDRAPVDEDDAQPGHQRPPNRVSRPFFPGKVAPRLHRKADENDADVGRAQMIDGQDVGAGGGDVFVAGHARATENPLDKREENTGYPETPHGWAL